MSSPISAADVDRAATLLDGVTRRTPLRASARLSEATGATVLLKREDVQPVRSYKLRGAYTLIASLTDEQRAKGVVCASAGNHAQGVAFACAALGVHARIYLPRTTPRQKRDRVAAIGGPSVEVVVGGDVYDDAAESALRDAAETGATVVPAFDAAEVMAGQGTIAAEIAGECIEELGHAPDVVVVPVGGGGLLGGVATWFRERHPDTRVVGVEPAGARSMIAALEAGGPVTLEEMDGFVDGAAVRRVGDLTYAAVAAADVEMVTVPEGAICVEMLALYQTEGVIAEPAGALAAAALPSLRLDPGSTVATEAGFAIEGSGWSEEGHTPSLQQHPLHTPQSRIVQCVAEQQGRDACSAPSRRSPHALQLLTTLGHRRQGDGSDNLSILNCNPHLNAGVAQGVVTETPLVPSPGGRARAPCAALTPCWSSGSAAKD